MLKDYSLRYYEPQISVYRQRYLRLNPERGYRAVGIVSQRQRD
jgi:hypothetical protein